MPCHSHGSSLAKAFTRCPHPPPLYHANKTISMEPESAGEECAIISWGCDSFHRWRSCLIEAVIISVRADPLLFDKLVTEAKDELGSAGEPLIARFWMVLLRCCQRRPSPCSSPKHEGVHCEGCAIPRPYNWRGRVIRCTPAAVLSSLLFLESRISTWSRELRTGWDKKTKQKNNWAFFSLLGVLLQIAIIIIFHLKANGYLWCSHWGLGDDDFDLKPSHVKKRKTRRRRSRVWTSAGSAQSCLYREFIRPIRTENSAAWRYNIMYRATCLQDLSPEKCHLSCLRIHHWSWAHALFSQLCVRRFVFKWWDGYNDAVQTYALNERASK